MADETVTIHLEIKRDENSLTGRAHDDDGVERQFTGRLGLLAVIDALICPPPSRAVRTEEPA